MADVIQIITEKRIDANGIVIGEQKVAYINFNGAIHLVRHDYEIGELDNEVDTALNEKIDAYTSAI